MPPGHYMRVCVLCCPPLDGLSYRQPTATEIASILSLFTSSTSRDLITARVHDCYVDWMYVIVENRKNIICFTPTHMHNLPPPPPTHTPAHHHHMMHTHNM